MSTRQGSKSKLAYYLVVAAIIGTIIVAGLYFLATSPQLCQNGVSCQSATSTTTSTTSSTVTSTSTSSTTTVTSTVTSVTTLTLTSVTTVVVTTTVSTPTAPSLPTTSTSTTTTIASSTTSSTTTTATSPCPAGSYYNGRSCFNSAYQLGPVSVTQDQLVVLVAAIGVIIILAYVLSQTGKPRGRR